MSQLIRFSNKFGCYLTLPGPVRVTMHNAPTAAERGNISYININ